MNSLKISTKPLIEIVDLGLFINKEIFLLGDIHIGYEECLNKQGVFVPRFQYDLLIEHLKNIFSNIKPKEIIINGDLKHEFGIVSNQEWKDTLKFIDFLSNYANKIVLIKGNHDNFLARVASKKNLQIVDHYFFDDVYICHGHKIPTDEDFLKSKIVIIGHEHPAVSINDKVRHEKFKCFLVGQYSLGKMDKDEKIIKKKTIDLNTILKKQLIVVPSFNLVTEGTDILSEELLSPFLINSELSTFKVLVVADKIYDFGKVKDLASRKS